MKLKSQPTPGRLTEAQQWGESLKRPKFDLVKACLAGVILACKLITNSGDGLPSLTDGMELLSRKDPIGRLINFQDGMGEPGPDDIAKGVSEILSRGGNSKIPGSEGFNPQPSLLPRPNETFGPGGYGSLSFGDQIWWSGPPLRAPPIP